MISLLYLLNKIYLYYLIMVNRNTDLFISHYQYLVDLSNRIRVIVFLRYLVPPITTTAIIPN